MKIWVLDYPRSLIRGYVARERYLEMCRAIGVGQEAATVALRMHQDEPDPYAAAWAWLALDASA